MNQLCKYRLSLSAQPSLSSGCALVLSTLTFFVPPVLAGVPWGRFGPLFRSALSVENIESAIPSFASKGVKALERTQLDGRMTELLNDLPPGARKELSQILMDQRLRKLATRAAASQGTPSLVIDSAYISLKACVIWSKECIEQGKIAAMKMAQRKYREYRYSDEYRRDCEGELSFMGQRFTTGLSNGYQLSASDCITIDKIARITLPSEVRYRRFSQF